ncbi:hypothetical protein, partial [Okeania sp. SIO2B9]|uniref:hypothetical protein n=1 Tax=Okeania sp. SIO2B9 TaxID=2607782 RepID=UPI0025811773
DRIVQVGGHPGPFVGPDPFLALGVEVVADSDDGGGDDQRDTATNRMLRRLTFQMNHLIWW